MIVLELAFTNDERRLAARPAHRAILTELVAAGKVTGAGPFADDSGAMLLFSVDEAGLKEIMAADAYYTTPGVTVVSIREWNPIV